MTYRKGTSIEKEEEDDLAAAPAINGEKQQALLLKLCRSRVIIGTVSCQWVSTHTILVIEQVRFALPVHDTARDPDIVRIIRLLLFGDVTDSTGMVQALVARRRSRLRHQRKLYNNWQTTKLSFRSVSS